MRNKKAMLLAVAVLAVFAAALLCGISTSKNAGKNAMGSAARVKPAVKKGIDPKTRTVQIWVDLSDSINQSPLGKRGIRSTYHDVALEYLKAIFAEVDDDRPITIDLYEFVNDNQPLAKLRGTRWEDVQVDVESALNRPTHPPATVKGNTIKMTLFSALLRQVRKQCNENHDKNFFVLVLSDGKPDEKWEAIADEANKFREMGVTNIPSFFVAPVEPDLKTKWRVGLEQSLAPLGEALMVRNNSDYRSSIKDLEERIEVR